MRPPVLLPLAAHVPRFARAYGVPRRIPRDDAVALTFDDGPHPDGTPAVLDVLDLAGAQATFFLVGEQVSVRQIAETVQQLVGNVPIVHVDDRPADLRSSAISGERAERELGWRVETPFHQGVRSYVAWVKGTQERPCDEPASRIAGNASTVLRQELAEL